jgi:hypothetical protein
MQPSRSPEGVLADGTVIAARPAGRRHRYHACYAAGQDGGPGQAWLPLLFAGGSGTGNDGSVSITTASGL